MYEPFERGRLTTCIVAVRRLVSGIAAIAVTISRLGGAGRMSQAMRGLNGASDAELASRGLSRSGEVNRIFG